MRRSYRFQRRKAGHERYIEVCEDAKSEFNAYISRLHTAWFLARQHPLLMPVLMRHLEETFPGIGLARLISGDADGE